MTAFLFLLILLSSLYFPSCPLPGLVLSSSLLSPTPFCSTLIFLNYFLPALSSPSSCPNSSLYPGPRIHHSSIFVYLLTLLTYIFILFDHLCSGGNDGLNYIFKSIWMLYLKKYNNSTFTYLMFFSTVLSLKFCVVFPCLEGSADIIVLMLLK